MSWPGLQPSEGWTRAGRYLQDVSLICLLTEGLRSSLALGRMLQLHVPQLGAA